MSPPIWIPESAIAPMTLKAVIERLRTAIEREARGAARNMPKTVARWDGGDMHALGAVFADSGVLGVKAWAHTPKGASPLELLWDAETGALLAVIEAFGLGRMRTAGMAGVATDWLADPQADRLALCGTGKQAMVQAAAVLSVRPIRSVAVFGREPGRREAFTARVRAELGVAAEGYGDASTAVADAPVVTLITRARGPFLTAAAPAPGAHINAMGSITPERQEFEPALLDRCAVVAVDSVEQACALSSEVIARWGEAGPPPGALTPLADLSGSGVTGRPAGADLTLFKSLGVGLADLALAEAIYHDARARGVGVELPTPRAVPLATAALMGADHG